MKNRASVIDKIPGEIYKIVEKEEFPSCDLSKSILKILNGVFMSNEFIPEWKDVIVVPIPKKGDLRDPNNYLGIALINAIKSLSESNCSQTSNSLPAA